MSGHWMERMRENRIDWIDNRVWVCRDCRATGTGPGISARRDAAEHVCGFDPCECVCETCMDGGHCDSASCAIAAPSRAVGEEPQ